MPDRDVAPKTRSLPTIYTELAALSILRSTTAPFRPGMRFKTCPCRFSAVTTDCTSSVSASGFNDGRVLRHWASVFLSSFWQTRKIKISFHSQWVLHSSLISPRLAKEEALCTYVLIGLNLWWKLRRINRNCQDVGVGGRKLFKCHRMRL